MGSSSTKSAINNHMFLWLRSNTVLNSSPLLFLTLSLFFLPLTLTTISFVYDDVIKTLTPYDVIKTLTIVIPTFTAATSLIIIRTTRPRVTLTSAVKSLPPLFTTLVIQTPLLLLSTLVIAFSPCAVIELLGLGLGFDVNNVKLVVVWAFRLLVLVVELIYTILSRESERRLVEFRGRLFLMVVFGVFRFGPSLLWMNVVANDSTYVAHFDDWALVVNRCVVYLLFSLVITQYVVMYTLLYLQRREARRDIEACGYVDGNEDDGDKVGGLGWFMLLYGFMELVWMGTLLLVVYCLLGYDDVESEAH